MRHTTRSKEHHMSRGVIACALGIAMSSVAFFAVGADKTPEKAPAEAKAPTSRPVNKFCPILTSNRIDPTVTYVYKGKVYGFCCPDCINDFKKDPEKYKDAK